jgi:hypothetical protein
MSKGIFRRWFLALHSGQPVKLLPEYAITYDPFISITPAAAGIRNCGCVKSKSRLKFQAAF